MAEPRAETDARPLSTAASAGVALGLLSGLLANFPRHDYFFGLEFVETYLARIMLVAHKAYLPPSRSFWLLLIYVLGGAVVGSGAGLVLRLVAGRKPSFANRYLTITTAASAAAVLLYFALWIHRGIPLGLSLGAVFAGGVLVWVVCMTRVIEILLRAARRWRWATVALATAVTILLGVSARAAPHRTEKVATMAPVKAAHPLLIIGLDAASWANFADQLEGGRLPNISGLVDRGSSGELESIPGYFSPSLWTTAVTGLHPEEHGIITFVSKRVPFTSNSRTAWALWEILPKFGQRSAFYRWQVSWPAEPVDGLIVSDRFLMRELPDRVSPPELTESLDAFADTVLPETPRASFFLGANGRPSDPAFEKRNKEKLGVLQLGVTRDHVVSRLGERALNSGDFDLVGVYFKTIDIAGHKFWRWNYQRTSPLMAGWMYGNPGPDQETLGPVIERTNEWVDSQVGRLVAAAGPGTNILICSDHGMTAQRLRSRRQVETGRHHHSGLVLLAGPDICNGCVLRGASLYDVFPTILYLLDLPIPDGLRGRPLTEAIAERTLAERPIRTIADFGERPTGQTAPRQSPVDEELIKELKSLGYLE